MDLFDYMRSNTMEKEAPLASRLRPSTLDEVVKIQEDGRAKRRAAEAELGRIEGELKQKLLDIRG